MTTWLSLRIRQLIFMSGGRAGPGDAHEDGLRPGRVVGMVQDRDGFSDEGHRGLVKPPVEGDRRSRSTLRTAWYRK